MNDRAAEFKTWVEARSEDEWRQISELARRAGVGEWAWDQAWEAALGVAQARPIDPAVVTRPEPLALAAAAGALAALEAGEAITAGQRQLLLAPFEHLFRPAPEAGGRAPFALNLVAART